MFVAEHTRATFPRGCLPHSACYLWETKVNREKKDIEQPSISFEFALFVKIMTNHNENSSRGGNKP